MFPVVWKQSMESGKTVVPTPPVTNTTDTTTTNDSSSSSTTTATKVSPEENPKSEEKQSAEIKGEEAEEEEEEESEESRNLAYLHDGEIEVLLKKGTKVAYLYHIEKLSSGAIRVIAEVCLNVYDNPVLKLKITNKDKSYFKRKRDIIAKLANERLTDTYKKRILTNSVSKPLLTRLMSYRPKEPESHSPVQEEN